MPFSSEILTTDQFVILQKHQESLTSRLGCPLQSIRNTCGDYDEYDDFGNQMLDAFQTFFLEPKILTISPDGRSCKFTEYGHLLFRETDAVQKEWEELPIIPLNDADKPQITIKAGEPFRGKCFVMQILKRANTTIRIQDNFCSHELLAWLYTCSKEINIRLLTSFRGLKQEPALEALFKDFRIERSKSELRITNNFHDRKIIVDDRDAFQIGESIKDIGRKGTTIVRLQDVDKHATQFDLLWSAAERSRT